MRILALLVMVFGVALAGGALFFASKYFGDMRASMATQGPEMVRILVAKEPLAYRAFVSKEKLQWVEWPKNAVPDGAFTSVDELLGPDPNLKRQVRGAIEKGEPILMAKVTKIGETISVVDTLEGDMRLVSISIDAVTGVAGFISPGARVDITMTRTIDQQLVSQIILQNVLVAAVDQRSNAQTDTAKVGSTVTVSVSAKDAQKLTVARQIGSLSLTLRGANQTEEVDTGPVSAAEIFDGVKLETAPKVRVRRAGSLTEQEVGGDTTTGGQQTGN